MMRFWAVLLAVFGFMATPAVAQSAQSGPDNNVRSILLGDGDQKSWAFAMSEEFAVGQTNCDQNWTFHADGGMTVTSGEQRIDGTWRVAKEDGELQLFTTMLSANDGRDCDGQMVDPSQYPIEEGPGMLLKADAKDGRIDLCVKVVELDKNGMPKAMRTPCWGRLTPWQNTPINAEMGATTKVTKSLTDGGEWTFRAPRIAGPHDRVCIERWTFRADGSMTVISGSQTVEKSWRVAEEDGFTKLYTTSLSSTKGTDCMGKRAIPADYPKAESGGFAVMFFGDGANAYLCNPVVVENADGTTTPLYRNEDCWGELRAVPVPVTVDNASPTAATTKPATSGEPLPVNY